MTTSNLITVITIIIFMYVCFFLLCNIQKKNNANPLYEHVPNEMALILSIFLPLIIVVYIINIFNQPNDLCQYFNLMGGLFIALSMSFIISNVLKILIKKHRPNYGLLILDKIRYNEADKSFPSCHAAIICTSVTYMLLIISTYAINHSIDFFNIFTNYLLCTLSILIACWISYSRILDNYHYLNDVVAGSFLGIFVGYACWNYKIKR